MFIKDLNKNCEGVRVPCLHIQCWWLQIPNVTFPNIHGAKADLTQVTIPEFPKFDAFTKSPGFKAHVLT